MKSCVIAAIACIGGALYLSGSATAQESIPLPEAGKVSEAGIPIPEKLTYVVHAYASFAPDDKSLVFQSNAAGNWNLYTMGIDGQNLKPIVTDPAGDMTPVYSHDGSSILFVSERHGNRDVFVCKSDGSDQNGLTNDPGQDIHPVYFPDGKRIMFSSNRGNENADNFDIYTMNPDGSDVKQVTSGPDVDTYSSLSPDGAKIVTRRVIGDFNNEVFVMNPDGTGAINLTNDPSKYDGWPAWSPDGRRIAFASGGINESNHFIYVMQPDGTGRRQLSEGNPGWNYCYDTQPAWSHDGKLIAFTKYRPGRKESSEIMVISVPSSTG